MEYKVRLLDSEEPKSVQEIERELVENHEKKLIESEEHSIIETQTTPQDVELNEQDVLKYLGKRYNKEISSFEDLVSERKSNEELPEDVAAYLNYKRETGRGFEDFIKLNEDLESIPEDNLIKSYLIQTQEGLDSDDIEMMMEEYIYDEDLDDESHIKKTKIAKKKIINEAKKFFESQKQKYKTPLESSTAGISKEDKEQFEAYRNYISSAKTIEEENNRKRQWFDQKTSEVFSNEFKGFEFNLNDKKVNFLPSDANELKKLQSTPANFINKFLDENGMIKDALGYHKALAVAMNPERFAKFFYEQGMADATDDVMRKTKNINMTERRSPEIQKQNGGMQVRSVNPDSGRNLKIRSAKRL